MPETTELNYIRTQIILLPHFEIWNRNMDVSERCQQITSSRHEVYMEY
jgi:hypothetical protein